MLKRTLGRSGLEATAIGMGCWAIGGPMWRGDRPVGWGEVDDEQSIEAIHRAIDAGATLFDTADVYGCGHSERVLGKALAGKRDKVLLASKFGNTYEEDTKQLTGSQADPEYIRWACERSLERLNTDHIDLYQFHWANYEPEKAAEVRDVLEELVAAGKIRWYGWSTNSPERAAVFAEGEHCTAVQQRFNIFDGNAEQMDLCERENLASLIRGPLAKGMLTGKFRPETTFPSNDLRHDWDLAGGEQAERREKVEAMRDVLTSGGRTMAQGALCWLLARSEKAIPIPGFKNAAQAEDNLRAAEFGPLSAEQMKQIDQILSGG